VPAGAPSSSLSGPHAGASQVTFPIVKLELCQGEDSNDKHALYGACIVDAGEEEVAERLATVGCPLPPRHSWSNAKMETSLLSFIEPVLSKTNLQGSIRARMVLSGLVANKVNKKAGGAKKGTTEPRRASLVTTRRNSLVCMKEEDHVRKKPMRDKRHKSVEPPDPAGSDEDSKGEEGGTWMMMTSSPEQLGVMRGELQRVKEGKPKGARVVGGVKPPNHETGLLGALRNGPKALDKQDKEGSAQPSKFGKRPGSACNPRVLSLSSTAVMRADVIKGQGDVVDAGMTSRGDDVYFHVLQTDVTQPMQGYLFNPKILCPLYRGRTDGTIKPQIFLGFKDNQGGMDLVCVAVALPKQML